MQFFLICDQKLTKLLRKTRFRTVASPGGCERLAVLNWRSTSAHPSSFYWGHLNIYIASVFKFFSVLVSVSVYWNQSFQYEFQFQLLEYHWICTLQIFTGDDHGSRFSAACRISRHTVEFADHCRIHHMPGKYTKTVIWDCQYFFGAVLPSVLVLRKADKLALRYQCLENAFCTYCRSI